MGQAGAVCVDGLDAGGEEDTLAELSVHDALSWQLSTLQLAEETYESVEDGVGGTTAAVSRVVRAAAAVDSGHVGGACSGGVEVPDEG